MNELWRDLRVGDHIQIVCMPEEFSQPSYYLHEDTRRLYEHLISERVILDVVKVDEWNQPWIEYVWTVRENKKEYHSLLINHSGIQRVE